MNKASKRIILSLLIIREFYMRYTDQELVDIVIEEILFQLDGLLLKTQDFTEEATLLELRSLQGDPLYTGFHLDSMSYVLIRLMGRMSISIGRRLGELYDKVPRILAESRYGLTREQIAPKFNGLEVDVCLQANDLYPSDFSYLCSKFLKHLGYCINSNGMGIEIRYNFNPNDSSRLRKDCQMAQEIVSRGLTPIYLVYSTISPRDDAIRRLERAGWKFLVGNEAVEFSKDIFGLDVSTILYRPEVRSIICNKINDIMGSIKMSYAFKNAF